MIFTLALKNFYRQGLRAFLNVLVTALTLIAIIYNMSLLNGFQAQATRNMVNSDVAGGHYVSPGFDLLTPTEWEDHTVTVPPALKSLPYSEKAETLIQQGQIFPNYRLYPVQLRGIEMEQTLLKLPLSALKDYPDKVGDVIPVILGAKMAEKAHLKKGDSVVMKWRDSLGAVDARDVKVVDVVSFLNPRIDAGVVWLRLDHLREMTRRAEQVSWVAVGQFHGAIGNLEFKSIEDLMSDLLILLKNDRRNSKIIWVILIFLAGISIFNTQILNIFKRQKEIGTFMALGMSPGQIVKMFTLEGSLAAIMAILAAILIGAPFFTWYQGVGFDVSHLKETTFPVQDTIFLDIRPWEVVFSAVVIVSVMIIVAWLPVRKISRLEPTLALRGRAIT
jgi:ABC-type lipoprotein release transport system permease subunit